ncbi:SDR family oxidoreductase [Streptomyces avicenniae]|uniref:SDR family oxidoreductase n=1 Tax=Streptomyces avicenniae TaxID=500153 RepID=UPI00069A532F|nr:SDR family oxidoreductase [Streptomyces avicenniae]
MTTTATVATAATTDAAAPRVWFVTGAGRGLGRAFTAAALGRGDRVAAAVRTTGTLDDLAAEHGDRLLVLPLDVTDRQAVTATVRRAAAHFGRLDIVVNNAGTMALGMVEEFTEEAARAQFDVNFFGALWVSQAVLPVLRAQGSGHIVQISSIGALGGHPSTGLYSASKFALEGMSEALAQEAAEFGVRLTLVEPGGYWTDLYLSMTSADPLPAYDPLRARLAEHAGESTDSLPHLAAEAVLKLVDSDDPPLRLLLGSAVYDHAMDTTRRRRETWEAWEEISRAAEHPVPMPEGYGQEARA